MNPELAAQTILQHFWHRHLPVRPIDIAAKLGKPEEARKGWNEALKRQPANAEALQEKLKQQ